MATLAPVLFDSDLPLAELCAARLDGELFALDDGFCPIDQPETRESRARSIAPHCRDRIIAERHTAAWIWGARDRPPEPLELCANIDARARPIISQRAIRREVVVDPDELREVAGILVTNPLRTAIDIARFSVEFGDFDCAVVGRLVHLGNFTLADCRRALDRRTNLPNKVRAWERLSRAVEARNYPELTR